MRRQRLGAPFRPMISRSTRSANESWLRKKIGVALTSTTVLAALVLLLPQTPRCAFATALLPVRSARRPSGVVRRRLVFCSYPARRSQPPSRPKANECPATALGAVDDFF